MTVLQALKTSFYFKNGVLLWEVPCQQKHSIAQGRQLHPHPDVGGKAQICPFANHWSQLTTRHYLYLNTFTVYIHAVISWDTPVKSDGTWSHGLELRDWNFHPILYRCIQVKDLPIGASQNSRFPPQNPAVAKKTHGGSQILRSRSNVIPCEVTLDTSTMGTSSCGVSKPGEGILGFNAC